MLSSTDPEAFQETIDSAKGEDGTPFSLIREGDDWMVRVQGRMLMSSKVSDSEEAMADVAFDEVPEAQDVLIGGLGLGYTLAAVLEKLPAEGVVVVSELMPCIIHWNRRYLGGLNDHPLEDPRCEVLCEDVLATLRGANSEYDAILLDVDNGPVALSQASNQNLYGEGGVKACFRALRPGGILIVWSAGENARYEKRMRHCGFETEVVKIRAREGASAVHVLFTGRRV